MSSPCSSKTCEAELAMKEGPPLRYIPGMEFPLHPLRIDPHAEEQYANALAVVAASVRSEYTDELATDPEFAVMLLKKYKEMVMDVEAIFYDKDHCLRDEMYELLTATNATKFEMCGSSMVIHSPLSVEDFRRVVAESTFSAHARFIWRVLDVTPAPTAVFHSRARTTVSVDALNL